MCLFSIMIMLYSFYLINHVFHLLIVALAIERFLIYFRPSTEKLITKVQNYLNRKIKFIYIGVAIKDVTTFIIFMCHNWVLPFYVRFVNTSFFIDSRQLFTNCCTAMLCNENIIFPDRLLLYLRSFVYIRSALSSNHEKCSKSFHI